MLRSSRWMTAAPGRFVTLTPRECSRADWTCGENAPKTGSIGPTSSSRLARIAKPPEIRVLPIRRRTPLRQRLVIPACDHPVDDVAADMCEFEVADLGVRIGFDPAHDLIERAGLGNAMSFGHHQPRCPRARNTGIHHRGEAAVRHRH